MRIESGLTVSSAERCRWIALLLLCTSYIRTVHVLSCINAVWTCDDIDSRIHSTIGEVFHLLSAIFLAQGKIHQFHSQPVCFFFCMNCFIFSNSKIAQQQNLVEFGFALHCKWKLPLFHIHMQWRAAKRVLPLLRWQLKTCLIPSPFPTLCVCVCACVCLHATLTENSLVVRVLVSIHFIIIKGTLFVHIGINSMAQNDLKQSNNVLHPYTVFSCISLFHCFYFSMQ